MLRCINRRMEDAAASEAANAAAASADEQPAEPAHPTSPLAEKLRPSIEILPRTPPREHHHISESKRTWLHAYEFSSLMAGDVAVEVMPSLRGRL